MPVARGKRALTAQGIQPPLQLLLEPLDGISEQHPTTLELGAPIRLDSL
jgi:hypothetical protein